jgi:NAD(P)H-hydrate epimerase
MPPSVPPDAALSSSIGGASRLIKIPEAYRPFHTAYADQSASLPSEGLSLSLLDAKAAKSIDEDLMSPDNGFSLDQLMELAGLSVASAALEVMSHHGRQGRRVLVLCGPGNNGGDGLVAARHLSHFGYNPEIYFPNKRPNFSGLITQCEKLNIPTLSTLPSFDDYDLVIDAIFGFSFKGPVRTEYQPAIVAMAASNAPVLAVDIPSGWDVERGDVFETGFRPAAVVSLTAPKMCLSDYTGLHYVGGRLTTLAFLFYDVVSI